MDILSNIFIQVIGGLALSISGVVPREPTTPPVTPTTQEKQTTKTNQEIPSTLTTLTILPKKQNEPTQSN